MMLERPRWLALACAVAAILATTGACAQSRPSLSDRVDAIEARLQQTQSAQSVEQLNRITQLESDVKALRALVEQMQNENQQAKDQAKAQYLDLDSRLARLESAAAAQPPAPAGKTPAGRATRVPVTPQVKPPQAAAGQPPATTANPTAPTTPATEQGAYDAALAAVRADQYADSAQRFNAFVQQYPDSPLAPNAYYWLGESYYVTQNYTLALEAFKTVVTRFADSPKAAGALLKLGYCQDGLKQRDAAQATLRDVIAKYPNSEEAGQAESRLRAMSMDSGG
jgi:tol-pal system protein YbgF